ncbi:MAG: AAA family ATPase [bacterium]|nr:AAA family ATPase [bacterium]
MRLKGVKITEFKRFADLTIRHIPGTARLVILAGPNGSGKSSFFEALHTWHKWTSQKAQSWDQDYHCKVGSTIRNRWSNDVTPEFHHSLPSNQRKAFYVRSAYRNDPEFQIGELRRTGDPLSEVRVNRMIDNDAAVGRNYQRLASKGLEDLYERGEASTTFGRYREESIGSIRRAMLRLFPDLQLNSLGNPLTEGTFRFTKGISQGFVYKNLSGGEKSAFDLILDLAIAQEEYNDTIFCIDEPESHMNTKLQSELLAVLYDLIPDSCQLMLATHSIGMMRRARDIEVEHPGTVVFLEFGDRDFDQPQIIEPAKPDRQFWRKAHQVALDDLAALVAPERVVICEGHPKAARPSRNHSQDARCYERIFEAEFPETRFVSMGSDREVLGDRYALAQALLTLVDGLIVKTLIDRDDRSVQEICEAEQKGVRVLSRRNLESYLFDDDVLRALAAWAEWPEKAEELIAEKKRIIDAVSGDKPSDDLKPASGQIYNACKNILKLTGCGSNTKAFMRDTLAPLINLEMAVYKELKGDIFGTCADV